MTKYEARGAGVYETGSEPTAYPVAMTPFSSDDRAMARRIADALNGHERLREALRPFAEGTDTPEDVERACAILDG